MATNPGGRAWRRTATTQCVRGHAYTPENTLTNGEGWRYCRECNRTAARERYRRLRIEV